MKKRKNRLLIGAFVLCVIALFSMILALTIGKREIQAEFTPPSFDSNACVGTPKIPEDLGWSELDAHMFKLSICGTIQPTGNDVDIWMLNPEENHVLLKRRILDTEGRILGESGLIKPGEYLKSVHLDIVPQEGTNIVLKIMAYEPETYYSAGAVSMNTVIR